MPTSRHLLAPAVFALSACIGPPLSAPDQGGVCQPRTTINERIQNKVDVLFVIDNSHSMDAMQEELRQRFGEFLKVFNDLAANGSYTDLQIGVVTTDVGAGISGAPGCQPAPGGQQGRLQAVGAAAPNTCKPPSGANFIKFKFDATGGSGNLPTGQDLAATFTCMASVGSNGCGFEHVLESAYAALHNDIPENAGFVREDALLALVFVTNEDDCSAPPDSDLFDKIKIAQYGFEDSYRCTRFGIVCGDSGAQPPYGDSMGPLNGCRPAPGGLEYDVQRYTDFFTRSRLQGGVKGNADDVILVAIDAPADPVQIILSNPGAPNGDYPICPQINEASNPPCVPVLQHSCRNVAQPAFFGDPAVRLNSVVKAGHHHRISSICDSDYTSALQGVGDLISNTLGSGCIPVADPTLVDCTVEDVTNHDDGTTSVAVIDKCSDPPTAYPCWTLEQKEVCQRTTLGGRGITIQRDGAPPPPHTSARVACGEPCK